MDNYDDSNYEPLTTEEDELPEESNNNRTFMIAVGILGGFILIAVACLVGVWLFGGSTGGTTAAGQQGSAVSATETEVANQIKIQQALTATAEAAQPTATLSPTPTATPPIAPPSPTNTPDAGAAAAAGGSSGTQVAATATVAAALTKAAEAQQTSTTALPTVTLPSSLSDGGIADEYGLPGLVVMALAFVMVILFARRLRSSPKAG